jgi:hypothetical protein
VVLRRHCRSAKEPTTQPGSLDRAQFASTRSEQWLGHGSIDPDVLPQAREELREIANALDTGALISPVPAIPVPPRPTRRGASRQRDRARTFDDDEIPF